MANYIFPSTSSSSASNAVTNLATVTGINGKVAADTLLYTCPVGKVALIFGYAVRVTAVDTLSVSPFVDLKLNNIQVFGGGGSNASFDGADYNVFWQGFLTYDIPSTMIQLAAGQTAKLSILTGATATTLTLAADVLGYLVDA